MTKMYRVQFRLELYPRLRGGCAMRYLASGRRRRSYATADTV